jgi:hypothetical protein
MLRASAIATVRHSAVSFFNAFIEKPPHKKLFVLGSIPAFYNIVTGVCKNRNQVFVKYR